MAHSRNTQVAGPAIAVLAFATLYGYWVTSQNTTAPTATTASANSGTHDHTGTNLHAGNVQSFADRHVEMQLAPNGRLRLYFYGERERQLAPVPALGMEMEILPIGENPLVVTLQPRPYPGEAEGSASRYEGTFSSTSLSGTPGAALTLPYAGRTYRVQWRPENLIGAQNAHNPDGSDVAMPTPLADTASTERGQPTEAERALFLTPGGKYTQADIVANGNTVAALKYRGQMASHNQNPKPGDYLCPVTRTVANPRFTWIIGGKTYRFCCPPCIEEFLKQAKADPGAIPDPESYRKK